MSSALQVVGGVVVVVLASAALRAYNQRRDACRNARRERYLADRRHAEQTVNEIARRVSAQEDCEYVVGWARQFAREREWGYAAHYASIAASRARKIEREDLAVEMTGLARDARRQGHKRS